MGLCLHDLSLVSTDGSVPTQQLWENKVKCVSYWRCAVAPDGVSGPVLPTLGVPQRKHIL